MLVCSLITLSDFVLSMCLDRSFLLFLFFSSGSIPFTGTVFCCAYSTFYGSLSGLVRSHGLVQSLLVTHSFLTVRSHSNDSFGTSGTLFRSDSFRLLGSVFDIDSFGFLGSLAEIDSFIAIGTRP